MSIIRKINIIVLCGTMAAGGFVIGAIAQNLTDYRNVKQALTDDWLSSPSGDIEMLNRYNKQCNEKPVGEQAISPLPILIDTGVCAKENDALPIEAIVRRANDLVQITYPLNLL